MHWVAISWEINIFFCILSSTRWRFWQKYSQLNESISIIISLTLKLQISQITFLLRIAQFALRWPSMSTLQRCCCFSSSLSQTWQLLFETVLADDIFREFPIVFLILVIAISWMENYMYVQMVEHCIVGTVMTIDENLSIKNFYWLFINKFIDFDFLWNLCRAKILKHIKFFPVFKPSL